MHQERDVGCDPGSPGWRHGPKAGAKPQRHPGIPTLRLLMGSLSPFTFRVTIERYEFSVIMMPIKSLFLWIVPLDFLKTNFKSTP